MLKNYLKIALRTIKRNLGYSLINLIGLSVGLACCILIFLWVQDELSYDRFQENKDRLYRVVLQDFDAQGDIGGTTTPYALAPILKRKFPEMLHFARFQDKSWMENSSFAYGDQKHYEPGVFLADPEFFKMFSFVFLKGNPDTALQAPHSIVITEALAIKYFGEDEPIGKILRYNNSVDLEVTGVLAKLPRNSHMNFSIIAPIQLLGEERLNGWAYESTAYVMLKPHVRVDEFRKKIARTLTENSSGPWGRRKVNLQPLTRIHLHQGDGDITLVYIFSSIALFILLIACMNYMNLATARSARRAMEVGLRKVVGAQKTQLVKQFFSETLLMAAMATLLALVLVSLSLGVFNNFVQKDLVLDVFNNPSLMLGLLILTLLVGVVSGSYPAMVLSAYKPVNVLKGNPAGGSRGAMFRKVMVIGQFAVSILLIIGTLIIHQQLSYIRNKDLGWKRDNVVAIPINSELRTRFPAMRNELLQNPEIVNVTAASTIPMRIGNTNGVKWEGKPDEEPAMIKFVVTEYGYVDTFDMSLLQGRNFSKERPADLTNFIVNEEAVKLMKLKDPIGTRVDFMRMNGRIIGVVKDFHFMHMSQPILPLILTIQPRYYEYFYRFVFAEIRPGNIPETLTYIKDVSSKYAPHYPFKYRFVDEEFNRMYRNEQYMSRIVNYFTFFALFIACLGLFGLASFMTELRTKEIGVRKVLGASAGNIVLLFIKQFSKWVVIGGIIACPVAYYAMSKWLSNYAYRIPLLWWPFVFSGVLALLIACLTVGYQSIRAALANPVDTLRSE